MDQYSQQGQKSNNTEITNEEDQGGYVAVLHSLEAEFYGPNTDMPPKWKILLYIRHRALRDWTKKKRIPKSDIVEATGIAKRVVEKNLKVLETDEYILVYRSKTGKTWNDNEYELHPKRYGTDYIYRKEGQPFVVIQGGKSTKVPSNETGGVPSNETVGYRSHGRHKHPQDQPPERLSGCLKNPLKEPDKKLLSEIGDNLSFFRGEKKAEKTPAELEARREFLQAQLRSIKEEDQNR